MSSLCTQEEAKDIIEKSHLTVHEWKDKSEQSLEFFKKMAMKIEASGPPHLGFYLLMGKTAKIKFLNQVRNLEESKISIVQGTALKI